MNAKRLRYLLSRRLMQINLYQICTCLREMSQNGDFIHCEFSHRGRVHFRKAKLVLAWITNTRCGCRDGWSYGSPFESREVCDDCYGLALNWQWSLRRYIRNNLPCRAARQLPYYEYRYLQRIQRPSGPHKDVKEEHPSP